MMRICAEITAYALLPTHKGAADMSAFKNDRNQTSRRDVLLSGVAAGVTAAFLDAFNSVPEAAAAPLDQPADLVDALHSAFGKRHVRAVHAKGVVLTGSFAPDPAALGICNALLFTAKSVPVVVRFSDFTGIPDIPDTVGDANPRGLAIKFRQVDGSEMDIVSHSFNGFPTKTAGEFGQLLRAIGSSGPDTPHPTPLEQFLESHPVAKTFLTTQKPAPESYATVPYFGVNSFAFIKSGGARTNVRYRFTPQAGEHYLDPATIAARGPNYLSGEIAERVAKSPIAYDWFAQVAASGDAIDDPSIAWPESRELVKLGTITIDKFGDDQVKESRELLFVPGNIPPEIEIADPMLTVRTGAYPISFAERQ
jgi:catalase